MKKLFLQSLKGIKPPKLLSLTLFAIFLIAAFYPSDLKDFYFKDRRYEAGFLVHTSENYLRFVNTALQVALPIIKKDPVGIMQVINIGVVTTFATHGLKYVFNDVNVADTRLGQRPKSPTSSKNMPSGHSSMAACAVYFVAKRYGAKWLFILLPILFLTMYARFMLDMHTISATIAGASLGLLCAIFFTSKQSLIK